MTEPPLPPEVQRLIHCGRIRDIPAVLAQLGLIPPLAGKPEPVDPVKMKIRRVLNASGTSDNRDGVQAERSTP